MIVLTEGPFGDAVGAALARRAPAAITLGRLTAACDDMLARVATASFVAVATWRPYDVECDRLDEACWRARVPWSAAFLWENRLYCGPAIVPPHGPCYACFRRRALTHQRAPERELAVLRAYRQNRSMGPSGFVTPLVWLAASALQEDACSPTVGRLRYLNVITGEMSDTRVVRVHACPRCGGDLGDRPGERFVGRLVPAVQELLP